MFFLFSDYFLWIPGIEGAGGVLVGLLEGLGVFWGPELANPRLGALAGTHRPGLKIGTEFLDPSSRLAALAGTHRLESKISTEFLDPSLWTRALGPWLLPIGPNANR